MMWRRTLALLILAATAACAGSAGTTEQTLRFRLREDPPTIDPAFVTDQVSATVVRRLHAGLVDFDPETLEIVPRVAERWDISDDGTIYTFHLRKGVLFHNGREVTAEDAAWSLRRLVDPATHSQRAWILSPVRGATAFREGQAQDVEGIIVEDPFTLRLELEQAYAPFLGQLAMENAAILPRETWGSPPADPGSPDYNIGCGPFHLVEWVHSNYMTVAAFDDYYAGRPTLDRIIFRFIGNLSTSLEEYRAGGLDILDEIVSGQRHALREQLGDELRQWPQMAAYFFGFNHQVAPFKGNRALRQAINYAVDKEYICRVLQEGKDIPQTGILPPGIPGYNPDLKGYPHNLKKAKELMIEAGYPGGEGLPEIPMLYNTSENHQRIATQIQSDLAKIGVRVSLRNLDWASFLHAVEGNTKDHSETPFFRLGWFADYPDPDNFLYVLLHSDNWGPAGNNSLYSNPEFDRLVDEARSLTDMKDRIPLYRQAEKLAVEDAAWLFLYFYEDEALVKPYVRNFVLSPMGDQMAPLENITLDLH
ncbi:MAG: ABC transporter substrate-binding protein [Acidobacteria bacterium]|nr:ABC transporter substrate-binding protein [Acidobacteriota bacterium]